MKNFFTPLYCAKVLALSLFFCLPIVVTAQTVIFSQGFSSHTSGTEDLTPYIGTGTNQFDHLGLSGSSTIRVANTSYPNQLRMFRSGTNIAFAKTTDLSPTPGIVRVKFKFQAPATTYNFTTAATFYFGSGFSADATAPTSGIHSRIGIGFFNTAQSSATYVSGQYLMRNMNSFANSAEITGAQDITWFINNSGATQSYTNPAGGTSTVGDDKSDMWVGTSLDLNFNEMNAADGTQPLTDFKFVVGSNGTLVLDDIEVARLTAGMPVELTDFAAKNMGAENQLTWATASEVNNKGYDVERQTAKGTWESLGFVNGSGKAATYAFEDKAPLSISYYRLRQVDFDGTETLSKVVSVSQDTKGRISITPNPTSDKVNINLNQNDVSNQTAKVVLSDMTGRQILTQSTTSGALELDLSNLAKGMYVLTVQSNNAIYQEKIIRQ
jgi:Secretion system C-terminal sorting domain